MAEKEIELLRELMSQLNEKDFDLEAWKNRTVICLEPVFGSDSSIVRMIRDLKYDYSSWALRDVSGAGKPTNPVISKATEIMEAAIVRMQTFGPPKENVLAEKVWSLLDEELTGKQVRQLRELVQISDPQQKEKISQILENIDNHVLARILAALLLP